MAHSWRDAPRFVKVLVLLQAAIIVGLSVWMYNEYVSNSYLRTYLASLLQRTGSIISVISLEGLIAVLLVGILLKAGSVLGDIEHLSERVGDQADAPKAGQDRPVPMPVLKVVEPEPADEIGRLHRSLRRWNERSK
jgi:hypothetical protein